jgi:hypothetical protein
MQNQAVDEQRSSFSKVWFGCRVVWSIIINLVYLALLFLAFDKVQSVFETLVLCLLVLIYQAVNWGNILRSRTDAEEALVQRRFTFAILQKLGEETSEAIEEVSEAARRFGRSNPLYYINLTGALIIDVAVLWKLVVALV